ncbi:phage holin family protein [Gramella sp. KN1008]|uniref:phage holin family protein n=1 Tax=Gramella sp. KN1008 TaxID=2529298 RepID=UPI00103FFA20|nr:phage holin family protein [Gramella sp. KN1008]TBW28537.1 hypothetical protein EZJ28_07310 [Gramella sp. KN1008]
MLHWVTHVLVDALVLLIAARLMTSVEVKGSSTATVVACTIGILSFLLSWSIDVVLALANLGIFYFLSIGFISRVIVFTIVIEIADKLTEDFKTRGFWASIWLAILIAIVSGITDLFLL